MSEIVEKKNVAYVYADLERSVLGLRSRVGESLAGVPVLRRTLGRLKQAKTLSEVLVFCPASQCDAVTKLSAGIADAVIGLKDQVVVGKVARQRKWALSGWRGGLGEATVFDEIPITGEMVRSLRDRNVYTALPTHAEAVAVDPELIDGLVSHHRQYDEQMRFTFSHAAPGLVSCAYRLDLLHDAVVTRSNIGSVLAYDPDSPHSDFINELCCFEVPQAVSFSEFRYIADTQRSFEILAESFGNGLADRSDEYSGLEVVEATNKRLGRIQMLPREIEIEINTEPSLRIEGYPHREGRWGRGPMSLAQFKKIVNDCRGYDDICLTIGGFGEPLNHPELCTMIDEAGEAGIFGINIETDGLGLHGETAVRLAKSAADVVSVYLDADSEAGYRRAKGRDGFNEIIANLETFIDKSQAASGPTVVTHLVKTLATMGEMESFYDRWLRKCGAAVIVGYNDYAGQIENRAVMDMSPPRRCACARLGQGLTILANGQAVICGQDYQSRHTVGNAFEKPISEIWLGSELTKLRELHAAGRFDENPLCGKCKEWHR